MRHPLDTDDSDGGDAPAGPARAPPPAAPPALPSPPRTSLAAPPPATSPPRQPPRAPVVQMVAAEEIDDVEDAGTGEPGDPRAPSPNASAQNASPPSRPPDAAQLTAATIALSRDLYKLGLAYLRRDPAVDPVELGLAGIFDRFPEIAEDPCFHDFVDLARRPEAAGLVRSINDFVANDLPLAPRHPLAPVRAGAKIQRAMEAWEADPLFADDAGASALQGLESYLFARLAPHQTLPTAEDRARDGALHFRAALLNAAGLSLADLGMPEDHAEAVQKMVKYGGFELLKIDMIGTPRLRVRAIVNFHKAAIDLISAFLAEGGGSLPSPRTSRAVAESLPLGGDVVLPALIWVILRVNPPHLPSNLAMLQRFRYAGFLTGEEGFAFTNLSAAITFLETADLTLFGVAPQLAERYPPRADPAAPPSPPPPPPAPAPEEPRGEATEGSGPPPPPALPFEPMQRDTASTRGNSWASSLLGSINR